MRNYSLAIMVALGLTLTGCGREVIREPYPVYIEVPVPQQLPKELLQIPDIYEQTDRSVGEYINSALFNTPGLRQCALQLEEIIKLQP